MNDIPNIVVIGAGYVGLTTAVCLAEIGNNVICVDISNEKIERLQIGESPIKEPELIELIQKNKSRLIFSLNENIIYDNVDIIIIICVQTPIDGQGNIELRYFWESIEMILQNVKNVLLL